VTRPSTTGPRLRRSAPQDGDQGVALDELRGEEGPPAGAADVVDGHHAGVPQLRPHQVAAQVVVISAESWERRPASRAPGMAALGGLTTTAPVGVRAGLFGGAAPDTNKLSAVVVAPSLQPAREGEARGIAVGSLDGRLEECLVHRRA
jgi:hypothetical protein